MRVTHEHVLPQSDTGRDESITYPIDACERLTFLLFVWLFSEIVIDKECPPDDRQAAHEKDCNEPNYDHRHLRATFYPNSCKLRGVELRIVLTRPWERNNQL